MEIESINYVFSIKYEKHMKHMKRRKSDYQQHFEAFERHNVFTGFTVIIFYKKYWKIETKHLMYNYNSMVDTCGCSKQQMVGKHTTKMCLIHFNTLNMIMYMKLDEIGVGEFWMYFRVFNFKYLKTWLNIILKVFNDRHTERRNEITCR